MREDMAKVIVERPRWGGGVKYPRAGYRSDGRTPQEECRLREGIRRPWRRGRKGLNENLAPLERFLRSQLGRPWDKVYAEICQRVNRDSAVQLHVWQHLTEYVCTNPHVIAGDVAAGYGHWSGRRALFVVNPRTGLLCENKSRRRRRAEPAQAPGDGPIRIDDRREFRRLSGVWYELELAPYPWNEFAVYDAALKKVAGPNELESYHGRRVYAVGKRQLNKKEIRRLPRPA